MKIGIDARFWNETGVGRYIRNIVGELAKLDTENEYVIFLLDSDFENISLPPNFKKVKANIRWHSFSEQIILPFLFLRECLDLLFVPHFNIPILYPRRFIVTIHDLTPLRVRTGRVTTLPYPIYLVKYLGALVVYFVAVTRSKSIFTVSRFVKNDLIKTFKVKPEKVVITTCAVGENFYRRSEEDIAEVLQKYGIAKPYLFYIGNAYPHKNLERLIEAFELMSTDFPNLTLVLGGKKNFFYERLEKESSSLASRERLVFPGFVDDADLPALYSGAEAYVNPSLYEGFGIQILEAFACGCKVICSNTTSLPEIGGDVATYFDPRSTKNMTEVIKTSLLMTPGDFTRMASERVKEFSWKESAKRIYEVIKKL